MKQKMTWSGVGVKMALFSLPYFILTVVLLVMRPEFFQMAFLSPLAGAIIGGIWTAGGIVFYGFMVVKLVEGLNKQKLMTTGVYGLTRNPLYADWVLFLIPGLAVIFRSWLLLAGAVVVYLNFKLLIEGEYKVLKANFGKRYLQYEAEVNEFLPLPKLGTLLKKIRR